VILIDAGPLVAYLNGRDPAHGRCRQVVRSMKEPMVTVWPAFTEAMYLVRRSRTAQDLLCELVVSGALGFLPLDASDVPRMHQLMRKYADLPMDLADAALVRVAERESLRKIFTLDRDFAVYRPARIGCFEFL